MRRTLATLVIALGLFAWAADVQACTTQTIVLPTSVLVCTVCCVGSGICTTICS